MGRFKVNLIDLFDVFSLRQLDLFPIECPILKLDSGYVHEAAPNSDVQINRPLDIRVRVVWQAQLFLLVHIATNVVGDVHKTIGFQKIEETLAHVISK
jgi:hypothetical protein